MKRTIPLLSLSLFLLPPAVVAANTSVAPITPAGSVGQMILGLAVTLALLVGGLWFLKRLQGTRGAAPGALRILGATAVGTREKIVLLGVGGKVLVLGVTPGRINTLHTLDESELPPPAAAPLQPQVGEFASRLKQFLERRGEKR